MASLFGAMLTAISTVYDREFGMLRLMLASPAGVPTDSRRPCAGRHRSSASCRGPSSCCAFRSWLP